MRALTGEGRRVIEFGWSARDGRLIYLRFILGCEGGGF